MSARRRSADEESGLNIGGGGKTALATPGVAEPKVIGPEDLRDSVEAGAFLLRTSEDMDLAGPGDEALVLRGLNDMRAVVFEPRFDTRVRLHGLALLAQQYRFHRPETYRQVIESVVHESHLLENACNEAFECSRVIEMLTSLAGSIPAELLGPDKLASTYGHGAVALFDVLLGRIDQLDAPERIRVVLRFRVESLRLLCRLYKATRIFDDDVLGTRPVMAPSDRSEILAEVAHLEEVSHAESLRIERVDVEGLVFRDPRTAKSAEEILGPDAGEDLEAMAKDMTAAFWETADLDRLVALYASERVNETDPEKFFAHIDSLDPYIAFIGLNLFERREVTLPTRRQYLAKLEALHARVENPKLRALIDQPLERVRDDVEISETMIERFVLDNSLFYDIWKREDAIGRSDPTFESAYYRLTQLQQMEIELASHASLFDTPGHRMTDDEVDAAAAAGAALDSYRRALGCYTWRKRLELNPRPVEPWELAKLENQMGGKFSETKWILMCFPEHAQNPSHAIYRAPGEGKRDYRVHRDFGRITRLNNFNRKLPFSVLFDHVRSRAEARRKFLAHLPDMTFLALDVVGLAMATWTACLSSVATKGVGIAGRLAIRPVIKAVVRNTVKGLSRKATTRLLLAYGTRYLSHRIWAAIYRANSFVLARRSAMFAVREIALDRPPSQWTNDVWQQVSVVNMSDYLYEVTWNVPVYFFLPRIDASASRFAEKLAARRLKKRVLTPEFLSRLPKNQIAALWTMMRGGATRELLLERGAPVVAEGATFVTWGYVRRATDYVFGLSPSVTGESEGIGAEVKQGYLVVFSLKLARILGF